MATVTKFATAASGTSWTSATNANADDAAYATYTIAAKNTTGNVNSLSSFGFDGAIPANSTINSVTLEVQHKVSVTTGIAFLESALAISGTPGTFNSDGTEPTSDTVATYSSMARPGGGSWTRADLLDAVFTVQLRARSGNNATSVVYSWDYAKVTVDYTPQAFTLTAAAGAYSLAGVAATLTRNKVLTAAAGSYTLTGKAATIVYGHVMQASAGAYSLTGVAATFSYQPVTGYTLTAGAGSYSMIGVAATLLHSKVLTAGAGAYVLSGVAASFNVGRVINAAAGAYVLTGQSAEFSYSGAAHPIGCNMLIKFSRRGRR